MFNLQHILNKTVENQINTLKPGRLDKAANEENTDIRTNLQDRIQELTKMNTDLENKYINKV